MPRSLPGRVLPPSTVDQRIERLTGALTLAATAAVQSEGAFHLALPADVPLSLDAWYTALVIDPRWRGIPWQQTHIWQSAASGHGQDASWNQLAEALVAHLPVSEDRLHPLPDPTEAADPIDAFAAEMETVFGGRAPRMDFAVTTEITLQMPVVAIDSWQLAAARNVVLWLDREPAADLVKAAGYFDGQLFWVRADQTLDEQPPTIDLV